MSRVTVKEAAAFLGISEQHLRIALRQDKFPFGNAIKLSPRRWTYYINRERLYDYIGERVDERLQ